MGASPCILAGSAGPLFAIHITPENAELRRQEGVLYLPPFAEEMNRCRRMASMLARFLAERGFGVLILDLFGTGDSAGNFEDARWEAWRGDAEAAVLWMAAQGYRRISLVGLRLGACLALPTATAPGMNDLLSRIVLWQPVTQGETFLNQFLRIRIAAGMSDAGDREKETVKALRRHLTGGAALEVAGYLLTPDIAAAIDKLDIGHLALDCDRPLTWIELGSGTEPGPASQRIIEWLGSGGIEVDARVLPGEPFWNIEETTLVPALWQETAAVLEGP